MHVQVVHTPLPHVTEHWSVCVCVCVCVCVSCAGGAHSGTMWQNLTLECVCVCHVQVGSGAADQHFLEDKTLSDENCSIQLKRQQLIFWAQVDNR